MTLPEAQVERFKRLKDHGDQKEIARLIGVKSKSTISRILAGKQSTSICRIGKIIVFLNEREVLINKMNDHE